MPCIGLACIYLHREGKRIQSSPFWEDGDMKRSWWWHNKGAANMIIFISIYESTWRADAGIDAFLSRPVVCDRPCWSWQAGDAMAVRIQPLYRKRQYQGQEWGQPRSRAVQTIKNYNSTITNISSFKSLPYRRSWKIATWNSVYDVGEERRWDNYTRKYGKDKRSARKVGERKREVGDKVW